MCHPIHTTLNPGNTDLMSFKRNVQWCAFWDYRGAELLNMLMMLAFGLWLSSPYWSAFSRYPEAYYIMQALGECIFPSRPSLIWGLLFLGMGIFKFLVIWRDHTPARKWTALTSGVLWTTVTITVGLSDYRAPIFPIYFLLAFNMYRTFFCIKLR